jgi:hypothetical protein
MSPWIFLNSLTAGCRAQHPAEKGTFVDEPNVNIMKSIVTLSLLLLSFALGAQTDRGDWLVGGVLSFNTTENVNNFSFTPSAGAFLVRNLALGGSFGISVSEVGALRTTQWTLGPFLRYYIGPWNYRPFLVAGAGYLSESQSQQPSENGFQYAAGAGLAIFIHEMVALEIIGEYNGNKLKNRDSSDGFRFLMGFQVYIDGYRMGRVTGK